MVSFDGMVVTDEEVLKFMQINFPHMPKYDFLLIRDILMIGRIYDNNYLRMKQAADEYDKERHKVLIKIEKELVEVSTKMRFLAGIHTNVAENRPGRK